MMAVHSKELKLTRRGQVCSAQQALPGEPESSYKIIISPYVPSAPFCPQKTSIKTSFASEFLYTQHYLIWKETTMTMAIFFKYKGN